MNKKTYTLVIEGFSSEKHAKIFAEWYEGQGEQDADIWFNINISESAPMVDVTKKYVSDPENGTLTIFLKP